MKTVFQLEKYDDKGKAIKTLNSISIIGMKPEYRSYLSVLFNDDRLFLSDKDMEKFAVNILKALNSKHLKQSKNK